MGDKKKIVHRDLTKEDMKGIRPANSKLDSLLLVAERALEIHKEEEEAAKSEQHRSNSDDPDDPDWSPATSAAASQSPPSTRTRSHRGKSPATAALAQPPKSTRISPHYSKGAASASAGGGQSPEPGKQRIKTENGPNPPPPLPQEFKETIQEVANGRNVSEPRLVIQKRLYPTDVREVPSRLSIPFNQMVWPEFLTEEEKKLLREKNRDTKSDGFRVPIIEPCLGREIGTVNLSRWDVKRANGGVTSSSYLLSGVWKHVVKRNELTEGTVVQLWAFRVDQELWFVLVKLPNLG